MTFIRKSGGRAVGDIFMHSGTTPPRRALACDAGRYYVTDYPRLFAVIQHRYAAPGDDTGDGLFRVPGNDAVQPFFRQAQKLVTAGFNWTPAPDWTNYQNMSGAEWVAYGYDYAETPEDGRDTFHAYRSGATSGAWSRYRWTGAAQASGMFYMPFVWQAKFNANGNTYHHIGLIKPDMTFVTALDYGIRIQAMQSGGTRVLAEVSALTPGGGVTNITGSVFPSGVPSFAGDTIELSVMLWFDLDGGNWGVQIGQTSLSLGAMAAIPEVGLCPAYSINWTGPSNAEGTLYMLHNSRLDCAGFGSLSSSAWDVAPINPPSGYANLFDWPDVVTYETGAVGGAEEHQHGGHALTIDEIPSHAHNMSSNIAGTGGGTNQNWYSADYDAGANYNHESESIGGGNPHTHPAASSLPPYVDVLYCIQAK